MRLFGWRRLELSIVRYLGHGPYAYIHITYRVCFEFALIVLAGWDSDGAIRNAGSAYSPAEGQPFLLFPLSGYLEPCHATVRQVHSARARGDPARPSSA